MVREKSRFVKIRNIKRNKSFILASHFLYPDTVGIMFVDGAAEKRERERERERETERERQRETED